MIAHLCRYCGKPTRKSTKSVYVKDRPYDPKYDAPTSYSRTINVEKLPQSMAECKKLTNQTVVSVKYGKKRDWETGKPTERTGVTSFNEWDGETYVDEHFCNGDHAKQFAYAVLRNPKYAGLGMAEYLVALEEQRKKQEAAHAL